MVSYLPSPFSFIVVKNPHSVFCLGLGDAIVHVGPRNKAGHPVRCHKQHSDAGSADGRSPNCID